jgi:hypothetical protein
LSCLLPLAYLPTCLPAYLPTCLPAYLPVPPAYLPASFRLLFSFFAGYIVLTRKEVKLQQIHSTIIVEGFLLLASEELMELFDITFFLDLSKDKVMERRLMKDDWLKENLDYFGIPFIEFFLQNLSEANFFVFRTLCVAIIC